MTELVLAVTVAMFTSALCSLFEAVLYSVPASHIESLIARGSSSGRILQRLREDVDRPIAAILSLNTIANTAGAAVAGAAAAAVFGHDRLVWFSAVFTLLILLFSEVVPKTAGVVFARALAPWIARPLDWLVTILAPLVWLSRQATRLISRHRAEPGVSDEELVVMARLGLRAGTMRVDEVRVIENVLALERKTARDIMTPRTVMVALDHELTADEARQKPGVLAHGRIPVYAKTPDDVVGILLRRDLLAAVADGRGSTPIGKMLRPAHFVTDGMSLDRLLHKALHERRHLLVAIDEHGGVAGILTLEDILEEILGTEIVDEHDPVDDLRELARRRREALLGRDAG